MVVQLGYIQPIIDAIIMAATDPILQLILVAMVLSLALIPLPSIYLLFYLSFHMTTTTTTSPRPVLMMIMMLKPNETAQIVDLLQSHKNLFTTTTTTTNFDTFLTTVLSLADDPADEVLCQRTMDHLVDIASWIVAAVWGCLIPGIVLACIHTGRYGHGNPKRIPTLVSAALKRMVVDVPSTTERSDGSGSSSSRNECGICWEPLHPSPTTKNDDDDIAAVVIEGKCRHAFHEPCISHWLCHHGSHYKCPMCRQDSLNASSTRNLRWITPTAY
jgi:Anaphase-promoting complex subunit 11 RING-H2 finger